MTSSNIWLQRFVIEVLKDGVDKWDEVMTIDSLNFLVMVLLKLIKKCVLRP